MIGVRICSMLCGLALLLISGCETNAPVPEAEAIQVDPSKPFEKLDDPQFSATDWASWRGPNQNGVLASGSIPTEWSESKNVLWKVPVPGRGHASPTIFGDKLFLATADEEKQIQSVVCYDKQSGDQLWNTDVHEGNFPPKNGMHNESSHASATVACDGERVFAVFLNSGSIWVTALDLDGKQLWQTNTGKFDPKFGYSASPVLHQSTVIIAADHGSGGYLAALHRKTGNIRWKTVRPKQSTYATPVIANVGGKEQLLIAGCRLVCSYEPNTGALNWQVAGTAEAAVGSPVWNGDTVIASGGYPQQETLCVKADGSKTVWKNGVQCYVPSILSHDGWVYAFTDKGIGYCWNAETGDEQWKARVENVHRASPILVGDYIYDLDRTGRMVVVKATPEKFDKVSENQLGTEAYASPAVSDGKLYLRIATGSGSSRQEHLYCIGKS